MTLAAVRWTSFSRLFRFSSHKNTAVTQRAQRSRSAPQPSDSNVRRSLICFFFSGCYKITTVFSHAQTVVLCVGCSTVLCQPTGGKARLTEGTVWAQNRLTTRSYIETRDVWSSGVRRVEERARCPCWGFFRNGSFWDASRVAQRANVGAHSVDMGS